MKIAGMSDIHGILEQSKLMEEVDILCIPGDWSPLELQRCVSSEDKGGTMKQWIRKKLLPWLLELPAKHIVLSPGNHDFVTERPWFKEWFNELLRDTEHDDRIHYLCNEVKEIVGLKIWGCPCSDLPMWAWFSEFTKDSYTPPEPVDIMLVHTAPHWGDMGRTFTRWNCFQDFGSNHLTNALTSLEHLPKLLFCGHIHGGDHNPYIYGSKETGECLMLNVAIKDEHYMEFCDPTVVDYNVCESRLDYAMSTRRYINGRLGYTRLDIIHNRPLEG